MLLAYQRTATLVVKQMISHHILTKKKVILLWEIGLNHSTNLGLD